MSVLKNMLKMFRLIAGFNKKYWWMCLGYVLLRIFHPFCLMFFIQLFIDGVLGAAQGNWLVRSFLLLGVYLLASCLKVILENFIQLDQKRMMVDMSALFCKKAAEMDYEYTENPEVLAEMDRASYVLIFGNSWSAYLDAINTAFISLGEFIFCMAIVSSIPFYFTAGILLLSLLNIWYNMSAQRKNYRLFREQMPLERRFRYLNKLSCDTEYGKTMRVFDLEDYVRQRGEENRREYLGLFRSIVRNEESRSFFQGISSAGIEVGIMAVLALQVWEGRTTIGGFTMILNAAKRLSGSLRQLFTGLVSLYRNDKYITDFFVFLERPSKLREREKALRPPQTPKPPKLPSEPGRIELRNVSFTYPGTEHQIIKNVSLTIEPGERLMIVGENGAGKTTLVKLMMRLYDVTEGEILYNGVNIKDYEYDSYMAHFSAVFQDFHIFDISVYENILFGDAADGEKRRLGDELLRHTGLEERVEGMARRGDTVLTRRLEDGGTNLSLGQQQMLAFARSVYKNGGTIVMDEPTASLSSLAESRLYQKFQELSQGKTAVFVSHRLSSASFCDRICVLAGGQVAEYGTHRELMERDGLYADMYRLQAQYYV